MKRELPLMCNYPGTSLDFVETVQGFAMHRMVRGSL